MLAGPPCRRDRAGEPDLTEELIGELGYVGIALVLVLGGLGLPIPEEAPIILAAVLTRNGQMSGPTAFATCLAGVILGDFVVYFLGFFYGEKVLSLPLTRRLLTRQREAQIKGYFHRHGFKILVSGRFVPGFRTAAYLTAGILKLPALKLLLTDLVAAALSTTMMFGLGLLFAHQIQKGIREVQQWITVILAVGLGGFLLYRYYQAHRRAGRPVGPPVPEDDDVPLPSREDRVDPPSGGEPTAQASPTLAQVEIATGGIEAGTAAGLASGPEGPVGGTYQEPGSVAKDGAIPGPPAAPQSPANDSVGIEMNAPSPQSSVETTSR
jgi:membrane protein DedA with SNARE-associated domain